VLRVAEAVARTDTGRERSGNEDAAFARPPLFVVADGMGGARGGEIASRLAVEAFEAGLGAGDGIEGRLAARVREANARIYRAAQGERALQGMGTTLTAAYLAGDRVAIAHVGDSRAYLLRGDVLQRLTQDHSLVSELVRHGKLTEEQAAEHPQRSIITRALGPEPAVEVDTWSYPVRAGDVLLLCSDGLTSMVSEERISEIIAARRELSATAQELIDEANAAGGRDNITVVLVRLEEAREQLPEQPTQAMAMPVAATGGAVGADGGGSDGAPMAQDRSAQRALRGEMLAGAPVAGRDLRAPARVALAQAPAPPRLARTQGRPAPPPPPRHSERWIKTVSALTAFAIVLGLILGGGYLASVQLYFISTNDRAMVTIYRGLPYQLPFGINLYATYYRSGVPAVLVPPDRRAALFNDDLRSQASAQNLVMALERGQISK
jgi:serine/threonine protein phosphatase PrpC